MLLHDILTNITIIENHLIVLIAYQVYKLSIQLKRNDLTLEASTKEIEKLKQKIIYISKIVKD